jgi:alanine dehydrogenase
MIVGTVRETKTEEYRVALVPDGVADIVPLRREASRQATEQNQEYQLLHGIPSVAMRFEIRVLNLQHIQVSTITGPGQPALP